MVEYDTAPGIHRIEDSFVNFYLVEEEGRFMAVDAGLPRSYGLLLEALSMRGASLDALEAIVLTHAHFDHVGFAERLRRERGIPVFVAPGDVELAQHPLRYRTERLPLLYMWRPSTLKIMATMAQSGALWAPGIGELQALPREGTLEQLPGRPTVIPTPGHTYGHVVLHFPDRDAVIAGDAVVTLDPYTAYSGPRLVARAATADSTLAWMSLDHIAGTGAGTVLVGHGPPWREGAAAIAEQARGAGAA